MQELFINVLDGLLGVLGGLRSTICYQQSQHTNSQRHIRDIENPRANWPDSNIEEIGDKPILKHTVDQVSEATRKDKYYGNEPDEVHIPPRCEHIKGSHKDRHVECRENPETKVGCRVRTQAEETARIQGIFKAEDI